MAQTAETQSRLLHPDLQVDEAELQPLFKMVDQRNQAQKAKVAGGAISKQLVGYADTIYQYYGGSGLFGGLFQIPLYSDSTLIEEFTDALSFIDQHAASLTYDPSSLIFGENAFSESDNLTIDSVHIFGKYDTPSSIPTPSGDSLIVELTWAPKNPSAARNDAFQGVYYTPDMNNPDTCFIENPKVDVSAAGGPWKLAGTNYVRTGIELDANDVAGENDPTILYSIPVNQNIPSGNLVAVSVRFKSAYSSTASVGDTFFSTISVERTKIPNFATRLASENVANGTRWFCDPFGMNSTGQLTKATLYQTNGNFRDGQFGGRVTGGFFIYLTVSGSSTFGMKETADHQYLNVYPNPTAGSLNIDMIQGGRYQLVLTNTLGQVVHSEKIVLNGSEPLRKDFSHLPAGFYQIDLHSEEVRYTSKVVLEK